MIFIVIGHPKDPGPIPDPGTSNKEIVPSNYWNKGFTISKNHSYESYLVLQLENETVTRDTPKYPKMTVTEIGHVYWYATYHKHENAKITQLFFLFELGYFGIHD